MRRRNGLLRAIAIFTFIAMTVSATAALTSCAEFYDFIEELDSVKFGTEETTCEHDGSETNECLECETDADGGGNAESASDASNGDESESASEDTEEPPYDGPKVLTYDNVGELSSGKNVVMFVVDRFDENYYETMIKSVPDYFDRLDGFTHYNNYTSLYARTYPAMASLLTGKDHDYLSSGSKKNKLNAFYSDGGGKMGLLKENGYTINLYTGQGNSYNDASVMADYVDNVSKREGETAYITSAQKLRERIDENGFKLVDSKGQFTLIHLYGCHDTSLSVKNRIIVSFDLIYYYIDQMKALGVYDDATIIITGDHPAALSDSKMIGSANSSDDGTRVTAMFFKRSGDSGTPLAYSSAQVSQDELWNTIFESEGLIHCKSGESFFDIPEGVDRERRYIFELYKNAKNNGLKYNKLIEYKIVGNANLGESWTIEKQTDIVK